MKTCTKCGVEQELTCFTKDKNRNDGLYSWCKKCSAANTRHYYYLDRKKRKTYDQKHAKTEHRKKLDYEHQKRMREKHRDKFQARAKLGYALKSGKLTRQPCQVCGNPKVEAHHDDYSKPLDVRWLCHKHHREVHGQQAIEDDAPEASTLTQQNL